MIAHLFVLGFILLLVWAMETTFPVKDAIKRYK